MWVFLFWMRDCIIFIEHLLNYKFAMLIESCLSVALAPHLLLRCMESSINIIIIVILIHKQHIIQKLPARTPQIPLHTIFINKNFVLWLLFIIFRSNLKIFGLTCSVDLNLVSALLFSINQIRLSNVVKIYWNVIYSAWWTN